MHLVILCCNTGPLLDIANELGKQPLEPFGQVGFAALNADLLWVGRDVELESLLEAAVENVALFLEKTQNTQFYRMVGWVLESHDWSLCFLTVSPKVGTKGAKFTIWWRWGSRLC
jgi:catabolite regulation protein CreA